MQAPADYLYQVAAYNRLGPVVTSVLRTATMQRKLYRRYLAGKSGGLPAAPPGQSLHQYGLAFDMVTTPYSAAAQSALGALWIRMGGRWGASDPVHFEART